MAKGTSVSWIGAGSGPWNTLALSVVQAELLFPSFAQAMALCCFGAGDRGWETNSQT